MMHDDPVLMLVCINTASTNLVRNNAPLAVYTKGVLELALTSFRTLDRYLAWLSTPIQCPCLSSTKAKVDYPTYEQTELNARVSHDGEFTIFISDRNAPLDPLKRPTDEHHSRHLLTIDAYLVNPAYPVGLIVWFWNQHMRTSETT